mgnify:CR=1 FL=1
MQIFTYNDYLDYISNKKIKNIIQNQNKKVNTKESIEKSKQEAKEKDMTEKIKENLDKNIEELLEDEQEVSKIINDYFKIQICDINSENLEKKQFKENKKSKIIKVKEKDIYFIIKLEKTPNYNIPYIIFNECIELIKKLKEDYKEKKPVIIPIIIYIGNEKWNIQHNNRIRYTSFEENNMELGYNILDFNLYKTKEIKSKKSKINKYILLKKEMKIYLIDEKYNL